MDVRCATVGYSHMSTFLYLHERQKMDFDVRCRPLPETYKLCIEGTRLGQAMGYVWSQCSQNGK